MREVRCRECGSVYLKMYECDNCATCIHNGVWCPETEKYIYPEQLKDGQERTQAYYECYCAIGDTMGHGCWLYKCSGCDTIIDIIHAIY